MQHVVIVGVGLIGGSIAMAIRKNITIAKIIGVDKSKEHLKEAIQLGIIDKSMSLNEACHMADLIILASPVDAIVELLPQILDSIGDKTTVIDLGSIKGTICDAVNDHPKRHCFVATHPMAGTENTGPNAAQMQLFDNKVMILCDTEKSDPWHVQRVKEIFKSLNMRITHMSANEQDYNTAFVSHLPHLASFALANCVLEEEKQEIIFDLAGGGFQSIMRLAKSNAEMWSPIFRHNKQHLLDALDSYVEHLQEFKKAITADDDNKIKGLIEEANWIKPILKKITNQC